MSNYVTRALEHHSGGLNKDDREALIDELMALVDFGQAIEEPYVEIAAERCLRIIIKLREGDGSG